MRRFTTLLSFTPVVLIMLSPLIAAMAGAATPAQITPPEELDRAVARFTGVPIGQVGGARTAADRRLRLAACSAPLVATWHGASRTTVKVTCPDPGAWHVYIGVRASEPGQSDRPIIKRGDPVTVMVKGRGFSVQQSGEALENGAVGEWIEIRTARKSPPVRARIERSGFAVIPAN